MGSKTTTKTNQSQTGNQTVNYGWQQNPGSADIAKLRSMVKDPNEIDPTIAYGQAAKRRDYNATFKNPLGSYTTPAAREAAERQAVERMGVEDQILAAAARQGAQEQAFGQQSYLASLTSPVLTSTGGTSSGTMSGTQTSAYNPGIGSYIAQGAGTAVGLL